MATVTIEYFGVEGIGRNVTEAKRDAGHKLEKLARECFPRIYSWRGHSVVCYATAWGGAYSMIHPDSDGMANGSSCASSREDAEDSGIRHLLSICRKEGEFELPSFARNHFSAAELASIIDDWRRNDEFQRRYREGVAKGMNDCDAHSYACGNPARPELLVA
jgi:hypothetical protein